MQKYIFILVLAFAIVRLELHSQGYSPSPNYIGGSWGFLYDRCNCDTPFRWEISYKDFPYMGANSLAAAIGDLHGHSIYTFRESNFLNPYSSAILPKQQIESLVIRSPQHSGLIKIIPNAENKNKEYIVYTADYDDYDDYLSISKKDTSYMKDIDGYQALYSAQAPAVLSEYLIFSIGGFDPSKNAVKLLGMPFSIEYTESYGDTLQIRKKAKIKYLPKPYLKLYKLKHIDRFTPSLGKAIKNQINSQEKKSV